MGKTGEKLFTSVLCSAIVLAASATAQAQSLKGYWKGDDGNPTPGPAVDSTGTWAAGTYTGGATTSTTVAPVTFANPTSMQFNGSTAYVDVPSVSWPATGGPISIAFWNHVTLAQINQGSAFSMGNQFAPNLCQSHAPWADDKKIYWDYGDYTLGRISTDYTNFLDKWTHVVLVSAGNGGAYKAIWLDGVEVATSNTSDGPDIALTGLTIGTWGGGGHPGRIDDFRLYDYVLSQTQITALANGNTEPATPTGLAATGGMNQVSLTWDPNPAATSFNLLWSNVSGGPYTTISVTGSSYIHTGLADTTIYYYRINAVNAVGTSANSAQVSATTLTPPPPPPRTQKLGSRHMCGWSSVGEADPWGLLLLALAAVALYRSRPIANLR